MCLQHVVELGLKTQHETKTRIVVLAVSRNDWAKKKDKLVEISAYWRLQIKCSFVGSPLAELRL